MENLLRFFTHKILEKFNNIYILPRSGSAVINMYSSSIVIIKYIHTWQISNLGNIIWQMQQSTDSWLRHRWLYMKM